MKKVIKGNEATAYAANLASVDVIPVYPITPSTLFSEKVSQFIANGEMDTVFLPVESEHSAMSAAIGASASGVRVMTATASQGLSYMHELLPIASGMRLPIVMAIGNRAISAPINIWNDQQDTIVERDSGWIQLYAETNQEVLDLSLSSFRIAEDRRVLLPVMICMDAFLLTHTMEPVDLPEKNEAMAFVGKMNAAYPTLDVNAPATLGSFAFPEYYTEFRYQLFYALKEANKIIDEVFAEFKGRFGRSYERVESYHADDADLIFISMGSVSGTVKEAVNRLRANGKKAGVLRIVSYRPFPSDMLLKHLSRNVKVVVVDRNILPGSAGSALYMELRSLFYESPAKPEFVDLIAGIGGRDITTMDLEGVYDRLQVSHEPVVWLNLNKEEAERGELSYE